MSWAGEALAAIDQLDYAAAERILSAAGEPAAGILNLLRTCALIAAVPAGWQLVEQAKQLLREQEKE